MHHQRIHLKPSLLLRACQAAGLLSLTFSGRSVRLSASALEEKGLRAAALRACFGRLHAAREAARALERSPPAWLGRSSVLSLSASHPAAVLGACEDLAALGLQLKPPSEPTPSAAPAVSSEGAHSDGVARSPRTIVELQQHVASLLSRNAEARRG